SFCATAAAICFAVDQMVMSWAINIRLSFVHPRGAVIHRRRAAIAPTSTPRRVARAPARKPLNRSSWLLRAPVPAFGGAGAAAIGAGPLALAGEASAAVAARGFAPVRTLLTLLKNSPAIRLLTDVSIRWPTPAIAPPTVASAS